jgi:cytochrome c biogenesis protein ResB
VIERLRKAIRFLASARLATWLLVFVGAWSVVATIVPQGDAAASWAAAHPALESVARVLDLHDAFSSLIFRAAVFALAVSTALCAWRRTRVALSRTRVLRAERSGDGAELAAAHDIEIRCAPGMDSSTALASVAGTLKRLGIRTKRADGVLRSISPWWSVWGSPVFHWGLLALIVVILVGGLQRSEGLMGVPVGQTTPDAPASYGVLKVGPFHNWSSAGRSIRVDAFDTDYRTGNIDRGPVPTVSVLDAAGAVIKTQRIYPNSPLQTGSLTIHPAAFGFAATVASLDTSGTERVRLIQLIDISDEASGGTVPLAALKVTDRGKPFQVSVTVPLGGRAGQWVVPSELVARVVVITPEGGVVLDRAVKPGERIALPTGGMLRLDSLGYYARLSVVDDQSIPLLAVALAIAMVGLTITVVARQQSIRATVVQDAAGVKVAVALRLWRNVPTDRAEIEDELAAALRGAEEDDTL